MRLTPEFQVPDVPVQVSKVVTWVGVKDRAITNPKACGIIPRLGSLRCDPPSFLDQFQVESFQLDLAQVTAASHLRAAHWVKIFREMLVFSYRISSFWEPSWGIPLHWGEWDYIWEYENMPSPKLWPVLFASRMFSAGGAGVPCQIWTPHLRWVRRNCSFESNRIVRRLPLGC